MKRLSAGTGILILILISVTCSGLMMCDDDNETNTPTPAPTMTPTPESTPASTASPTPTQGRNCPVIMELVLFVPYADTVSLYLDGKKLCESTGSAPCVVEVILPAGLYDFRILREHPGSNPYYDFMVKMTGPKNTFCILNTTYPAGNEYIFTMDIRPDCMVDVRDEKDYC